MFIDILFILNRVFLSDFEKKLQLLQL